MICNKFRSERKQTYNWTFEVFKGFFKPKKLVISDQFSSFVPK